MRRELVHSERLGDVVVGAELERFDDAGLVRAAGQDDDRNGLPRSASVVSSLCPGMSGSPRSSTTRSGALALHFSSAACRSEPRRPHSLARSGPTLKNLRIGGSSSTTRILFGAAVMGSSLLPRRARRLGSLMVKTAPLRSVRLPAAIVPPIASTKPRQIARPRPVPARTLSPFRARVNLPKTLSRSASAECPALVQHLHRDGLVVCPMPGRGWWGRSAYFAALSKRLKSTCSNSTGSTLTIGRSGWHSTST